jgi:hemerythrin-like domain-containing protein
MPEALTRLQEEHKTIVRLLDALAHQVDVFDTGERPDYDVLAAIADYFTGFPDRCHHPKEDLILQRLRQRDPAAAEAIGDLEAEHERVGELARRFKKAVQNVLDEVEVSRDAFAMVARHFVDCQRKHLQMEEQRFFPVARAALSADDWAEIDRVISQEEDPLFGSAASAEYAKLRDNILKWEAQDEARDG